MNKNTLIIAKATMKGMVRTKGHAILGFDKPSMFSNTISSNSGIFKNILALFFVGLKKNKC